MHLLQQSSTRPPASAYGEDLARCDIKGVFFLKRWFPRRSGLTVEQRTGSPAAAAQKSPVSLASVASLDRRIRRSQPRRILRASHRPALVTLALAHRHFPSAVSDDDTWRPHRSHVLLAGDLRSPDAAVRVLAER